MYVCGCRTASWWFLQSLCLQFDSSCLRCHCVGVSSQCGVDNSVWSSPPYTVHPYPLPHHPSCRACCTAAVSGSSGIVERDERQNAIYIRFRCSLENVTRRILRTAWADKCLLVCVVPCVCIGWLLLCASTGVSVWEVEVAGQHQWDYPPRYWERWVAN